jgi:hypothetical protein
VNQQPKPFDLEAAKNGAEILYCGEPAEFIAHLPENDPDWRLVIASGWKIVALTEDGRAWTDSKVSNLTMAPRKEKTVGYRDYYVQIDKQIYRYRVNETGMATPDWIESHDWFIRWIHTEWQYDEVII